MAHCHLVIVIIVIKENTLFHLKIIIYINIYYLFCTYIRRNVNDNHDNDNHDNMAFVFHENYPL